MYCSTCGTEIPIVSKFCLSCGKAIPVIHSETPTTEVVEGLSSDESVKRTQQRGRASITRPQNKPTSFETASRKSQTFSIGVIALAFAVIALLVVAVLAFIVRPFQARATANRGTDAVYWPSNPTPTPAPTPYWKHVKKQVTAGAFTLGPREMKWFPINIAQGWQGNKVTGRFEASGGSGNDVYVVITDSDGLANMSNGHGYKYWYNSGKTTVDSIDVTLAPGNYYVVFSNRMSMFSNKAINANITLDFDYLYDPNWRQNSR